MNNTNEEPRFQEWTNRYNHNKLGYIEKSIWESIGTHPQDVLFLELGEMYINADLRLKTKIRNLFDKPEKIFQLTLFIRRIAKMIDSNSHTSFVKIGFAIADIVSGKDDLRDVLTSLAILKYGAEKAGINVREVIEYESMNYTTELNSLIQNLMKWSEIDINLSIKWFGPADWIQTL